MGKGLEMEKFGTNILWPFWIYYGHLACFMAIWWFSGHLAYFPSFGMLYQEKSGNPDLDNK
jgi:hypothetical protein